MKCLYPVKYGKDLPYIPCGKCRNCKVNHQQRWATRMVLETKHHGCGAWVTLTYNDEHLPEVDKFPTGNLNPDDVTKFLKRIRKIIHPFKISYFYCGEYGSEEHTFRPHYHMCIFGLPAEIAESKIKKAWTLNGEEIGHVYVDDLLKDTYKRAKYIMKYTLKSKINEKDLNDKRHPEFVRMSKRPALGKGYLPRLISYCQKYNKIPMTGASAELRWYISKHRKELVPWYGEFYIKDYGKKPLCLDEYLCCTLRDMVYPGIEALAKLVATGRNSEDRYAYESFRKMSLNTNKYKMFLYYNSKEKQEIEKELKRQKRKQNTRRGGKPYEDE